MIPDGLSVTINCYLGIAVGEGNLKKVRNILSLSILTFLVCTICTMIIGISMGPFFRNILKTDEDMAA